MVGTVLNINLLIAMAIALVYAAIAGAIARLLRRRRPTEHLTYPARGMVRPRM